FAGFLREWGLSLAAVSVTVLLFALAPLHVRIAASGSEHVLSSTLTIAVLLAWTRGVQRRRRTLLVLALLLVPFVALTRPDAWPALAMVPLWSLLRPRGQDDRRREIYLALGYAALWAAVGAIVYVAVVVPAHHPGPDMNVLLERVPQ